MPPKHSQQQNTGDGEGLEQPAELLAFPHTIGDPDDDGSDLLGDDDGDDVGDGGPGGDDSDLRDDIKQLREDLRSKDQMITRLMGQQQQGGQPAQTSSGQDLDINLDDLPDAVEKPQDFKKALSQKLSSMAQQTNQQSQAQQRQMAIQQLETGFKAKYSDLASKRALMRAAVTEESQDLRSQGIDPEQHILNNQEEFLDRVADRMQQELGHTGSEDEGGQPSSRRRSGKRTTGVSGGSAPSAPRKRGGSEKKPPSFAEQLKKSQLDAGLI